MSSQNHEIPQKVRMGLVSFRERSFYKAHEYFEEAWRETYGPKREFFRILLHISGGFFRLSEEKTHAARKFFEHALKWLTIIESAFYGFDLENSKELSLIHISEPTRPY